MGKKRRPAKKPADEQKQAEKRARREERKLAEAKAKQQEARRRKLRTALVVLVGVLVVAAIGVAVYPKLVPGELPGVSKPTDEGRSHLAAGQTATYATPTPTSGTHSASAARCGISSQQIPPEFAVHALEHGTVVIWYQPGLSADDVSGVRDIVNRFDDRVILSPNAQLTQPIVATAWNRLKAYESVDPEIEEFIDTYRARGPEGVPCPY
ncbi:MAG: hypothetical protein BMS9Abin07_1423 [Acidimicrobiia bacterium]|nr:MAG: hypothetical protein BMS9Abin07_1423 [Acidimicrobiia bacterium]